MSRAQFPASRPRPRSAKSDFVVRKTIDRDLDRLAEIHAACYPDGRTTTSRLARFTHNPLGTIEAARTVLSEGRIVGHAFLFDTKTSFGGRMVPSVGIATVGIAPEERGRGFATLLLNALHDEARERGACVSVLHAFRHAFYKRVGYVATSPTVRARISPRALPPRSSTGLVTRAAKKGDRKTIEHLYSNSLSTNTGWIARSRSYWDELFTNERLHFSVVQNEDRPVGYTAWSLSQPEPHARTTLRVRECIGDTASVQRAIFSMFSGLRDQVDVVEIDLPIDSPWLQTFGDGGHPFAGTETLEHPLGDAAGGPMVRILDRGKAIAARGYATRGALTFQITDRDETWTLSSRGAETTAKQTTKRPDVRLTESALASLLFGAQPLSHSIWLGDATCTSAKARALVESMVRTPGYHSIDPF